MHGELFQISVRSFTNGTQFPFTMETPTPAQHGLCDGKKATLCMLNSNPRRVRTFYKSVVFLKSLQEATLDEAMIKPKTCISNPGGT